MSDQKPYPPPPPYDASRNRGIIHVDEPGPDGTPVQLELYPVPAEALSLVSPNQVFGISNRELRDASPEVQYLVMEAWFRLNHQPALPQVQVQYGARAIFSPREQLAAHFSGPGLEGLYQGGERLVGKLQNEARVWSQKPPEPFDARRQTALRALDELEAVIRQSGPDTPGLGHNHPDEPLDDSPATLNQGRREALVAIEDSRRELGAERPNFEVLRRSAQTIIKLARIASDIAGRAAHTAWPVVRKLALGAASVVAGDAYANGPDAAIAHVTALWHTGVKAAMALQAFVGSL